jgi:hypothetical protein
MRRDTVEQAAVDIELVESSDSPGMANQLHLSHCCELMHSKVKWHSRFYD